MSEVNLNFTVNNFSSTMLVDNNEIVVNPVTTDLTVFAGFAAFPPQGGAGNGQVIFNNAGLFDSSSFFTYDKQTGLMSVPELYVESINAFGNVMLGNVTGTGNISIAGNISGGRIDVTNGANLGQITNLTLLGGSEGQYLRTDGNGTVTFSSLSALGPNGSLQFNNANVLSGIPNVTFSGGNLNLGNSDSVKITGGENSYVLQTDGTGNLTWIPQAGNIQPGNGIPGGANSQVQFNNAGTFGGDPGFTYNRNTDTLNVENLIISNSITSFELEFFVANLTSSGNIISNGSVISSGNIISNGSVIANSIVANSMFYPNGASFVTSPSGSNTQVQFNNAGSFGSDSNFTFDAITDTLSVGNMISSSFKYPNGISVITNPAGTNTEIQFNNAGTFGSNANLTFNSATKTLNTYNAIIENILQVNQISATGIAGTLSTAAQPNVTSLGTLTNLKVQGPLTIERGIEKFIQTGVTPSAITNFNILNPEIQRGSVNTVGNFVLNFIGNATTSFSSLLNVNESITVTYIHVLSTTSYIITGILIDSGINNTVSIKWNGGAPLAGTVNGEDLYTFNILKSAPNTYIVYANYGSYR